MKTLVKYLSLLIFSGLIIPFYIIPAVKAYSKPQVPRTMIYHISSETDHEGFSFYKSVVKKIFPVLKNLN